MFEMIMRLSETSDRRENIEEIECEFKNPNPIQHYYYSMFMNRLFPRVVVC